RPASGCKCPWRAEVYDRRSGTKIRKTFSGEGAFSEAKSWRNDAATALPKGTMTAPTRESFGEAAEAWMNGVKTGLILNKRQEPYKPSARRTYFKDLEVRAIPMLGARRLSELRRRDVQAFVDAMRLEGMSASRIHGVMNSVRAVCRHAVKTDKLAINPCA